MKYAEVCIKATSSGMTPLKPKALVYIISGQCLYIKCKVFTFSHTCNLPVTINSVGQGQKSLFIELEIYDFGLLPNLEKELK